MPRPVPRPVPGRFRSAVAFVLEWAGYLAFLAMLLCTAAAVWILCPASRTLPPRERS